MKAKFINYFLTVVPNQPGSCLFFKICYLTVFLIMNQHSTYSNKKPKHVKMREAKNSSLLAIIVILGDVCLS